ncbi:hypothetical protein OE88DRAFT_1658917 [Heliocybe sulcata]|uniref:Uncharacterized protein n=1 Tax=Heliocybe sulcata TaxID=5364 RepID=A0A5C3N4R4_9AGAM|nr:hypothetical protein OE88DRAFT_1658917 [Heliocybe sulcata]
MGSITQRVSQHHCTRHPPSSQRMSVSGQGLVITFTAPASRGPYPCILHPAVPPRLSLTTTRPLLLFRLGPRHTPVATDLLHTLRNHSPCSLSAWRSGPHTDNHHVTLANADHSFLPKWPPPIPPPIFPSPRNTGVLSSPEHQGSVHVPTAIQPLSPILMLAFLRFAGTPSDPSTLDAPGYPRATHQSMGPSVMNRTSHRYPI